MERRSLGDTGIQLSVLGLGTVKLGRSEGVRYPKPFAIPSDSQARQLLDTAAALGINLLDTAPAYGNSEERLGRLLKGQREQWVLCTKAGEEFDQGRSRHDFRPRHLRASVHRSLQRLNTDCLDIVLLHSDGQDTKILREGALEVLKELRQQGLIRAVGMSVKTVEGGMLAAEQGDVVMLSYRPDYKDEAAVLAHCAEHRTGAFIKKVLDSGHVAGQGALAENLRFALAHPATTAVMVGTISEAHLRENCRALGPV